MFNTTNYKSESKVVAVTKVIEKSITPDKVTEMYDKIYTEVEKAIIQKLVVNNNLMKGAAIELNQDHANNDSIVLLRFTLNGEEHFGRKVVDRNGLESLPFEKLHELLKEFYTEEVRNLLLEDYNLAKTIRR
jgi:hypothetical protein